jgi:hypothetical protein
MVIPREHAKKTAKELKLFIEENLNEDIFCPYVLKCKIGETFGTLVNL